MTYIFKYDSVHGQWKHHDIKVKDEKTLRNLKRSRGARLELITLLSPLVFLLTRTRLLLTRRVVLRSLSSQLLARTLLCWLLVLMRTSTSQSLTLCPTPAVPPTALFPWPSHAKDRLWSINEGLKRWKGFFLQHHSHQL